MIVIENIHKKFGKQTVLKGVSLTIPKGTIQVMLGANGAGKSTLIHILSGLMAAQEGTIHLDNELVNLETHAYRRKVGYVFEKPMYIEKLSAKEYFEFVAQLYEIPKSVYQERIYELLDFLELPQDNKKYIESYSKGMKGKVSIGAALLHEPSYLILDEPFDGLDFLSIQKISNVLKKFAEKGGTILVTSHQYDAIADLNGTFALLKDGKIQFNLAFMELEKKASAENKTLKSFLEELMASASNNQSLTWI